MSLLTTSEAEGLVERYMARELDATPTQELLNSGAVPKLKGFVVRPGKVSDSIHGGEGHFFIKPSQVEEYRSRLAGTDVNFGSIEEVDGEERVRVDFENPELRTEEGVDLRLMVRSERISTHDITRGTIPFKDQILATNHNYMRRLLTPALGTSQLDVPGLGDNAVVIAAENLRPIAVENVVRGYNARSSTSTSLYQAFMRGERIFCGHRLPDDLVPNGRLPYAMDTPSTKSDVHDMSVSPDYLAEHGICAPEVYQQIRNAGLTAFGMGSLRLSQSGLILVDTKFEHGVNSGGQIVGQDEFLTMDSSRFWEREDYDTQLALLQEGREAEFVEHLERSQLGIKEKAYRDERGKLTLAPRSLSKEFARGFSRGEEGYTDEQRAAIAVRYVEGVQRITGERFEPDIRPKDERVVEGLETVVEKLVA